MLKRLPVSYGAQLTDCLIDLENLDAGIVSYMDETNKAHELWGGQMYYCSRTGLTGEGYLQPQTLGLLKVGCYRADCPGQIFWAKPISLTVLEGDKKGEEIDVQILIPITNGGVIPEHGHPAIVRVGDDTLIFTNPHAKTVVEKLNFIRKGKLAEELGNPKAIEIPLYNPAELGMGVYNMQVKVFHHPMGRGLNYIQFIDTRPYQVQQQIDGHWMRCTKPISSVFSHVGFYNHATEPYYVYVQDKVIQKIYPHADGDPLYREDVELPPGYKRLQPGVIAQSLPFNKIWLGCVLSREDLLTETEIPGVENPTKQFSHLPDWYDFELEIDQVEFCQEQDFWIKRIQELAEEKFKRDLTSAVKKHRIDEKIGTLDPEMLVFLQDSIDAGNCRPGTETWVKRHFPGRDSVKVSELLPYREDSDVLRVLRHLTLKYHKDMIEENEVQE